MHAEPSARCQIWWWIACRFAFIWTYCLCIKGASPAWVQVTNRESMANLLKGARAASPDINLATPAWVKVREFSHSGMWHLLVASLLLPNLMCCFDISSVLEPDCNYGIVRAAIACTLTIYCNIKEPVDVPILRLLVFGNDTWPTRHKDTIVRQSQLYVSSLFLNELICRLMAQKGLQPSGKNSQMQGWLLQSFSNRSKHAVAPMHTT